MNWINDILHGVSDSFRHALDSIKADVYEYCDALHKDGATAEEAHAIASGMYELWAEGNFLQYLYLKYIDDWLEEVDKR